MSCGPILSPLQTDVTQLVRMSRIVEPAVRTIVKLHLDSKSTNFLD